MYNNKIYMYREKKYPHDGFVMSIIQKSWLTFFIKPETQQPIIVIILIIYSPCLLKNLVEL